MHKVEDRHGFEIRLQEPTPTRSLWAALLTSDNPLLAGKLDCCVKVCLAFTREDAMEKAHAFVDEVADRVGMTLSEGGAAAEAEVKSPADRAEATRKQRANGGALPAHLNDRRYRRQGLSALQGRASLDRRGRG